jgi:hypothetical protein
MLVKVVFVPLVPLAALVLAAAPPPPTLTE